VQLEVGPNKNVIILAGELVQPLEEDDQGSQSILQVDLGIIFFSWHSEDAQEYFDVEEVLEVALQEQLALGQVLDVVDDVMKQELAGHYPQ
jgi:hypothetical protein